MVPLLERQVQAELFPMRTLVDNTLIEFNAILTGDQFLLRHNGDQQSEYSFKLDTMPFPELTRLDNQVISLRLKSFAEPVSKFMAGVLRKPLRYRLEMLDLTL